MADTQEVKLDETVEGGKYLNEQGKLVDANGVPLKEKASDSDTSKAK